MNLALFIDESGKFESDDDEWVLAGLLCRSDLPTADAVLSDTFNKMVGERRIPCLPNCHMTEVRSLFGPDRANEVRDELFAGLFSCRSLAPTLVACVNEARRRVDRPERTYRTMLIDMLALVESALAETEPIEHFDVVIATRTKDGRRLTTIDDLEQHARDTLSGELEVGLASRGLWRSWQNDSLRLQLTRASESWGIVPADFAANVLQNRTHREQAVFVRRLKADGRLRVFESFGGYEERRARVAERDGDRVAAIGRWATMTGSNRRLENAASGALKRLWCDLFRLAGTTGPLLSLESVLEWLARRNLATDDLLRATARIEDALTCVAEEEAGVCDRLLYRLRNFKLRNINHVGRCDEADRIIGKQRSALEDLRAWPEALPYVLEFGAIAIESAVNKLDFPTASARAAEHLHQVGEYLAVWELFNGQAERSHGSRWYIRAASAFVRARTLATSPAVLDDDAQVSAILSELRTLQLHRADSVRLQCYRILRYLRSRRIVEALAQSEQLLGADANDFALLWVARSVNDAHLAGIEPSFSRVVLDRLRARTVATSVDHPADLLWRERGALECFVGGDRKISLSCFEKSLEVAAAQDLQAPIGAWLQQVVRIHRDALFRSLAPLKSYFVGAFSDECKALLLSNPSAGTPLETLLTIRRSSPY